MVVQSPDISSCGVELVKQDFLEIAFEVSLFFNIWSIADIQHCVSLAYDLALTYIMTVSLVSQWFWTSPDHILTTISHGSVLIQVIIQNDFLVRGALSLYIAPFHLNVV